MTLFEASPKIKMLISLLCNIKGFCCAVDRKQCKTCECLHIFSLLSTWLVAEEAASTRIHMESPTALQFLLFFLKWLKIKGDNCTVEKECGLPHQSSCATVSELRTTPITDYRSERAQIPGDMSYLCSRTAKHSVNKSN